MKTRLTVIRHGQPEIAALGTHYGQLDVDLSDTGRAQSRAVVERLAAAEFDAIWSSDLRRCAWLAGLLATPRGLPVRTDPAFRERSLGVFQGMTYADAAESDPEQAAEMRRLGGVHRPGGGENFEDLRARVLPALTALVAAHAGQHIALACHGGPIRVITGDLLGIPVDRLERVRTDYCGVFEFEFGGRLPRVRRLNA